MNSLSQVQPDRQTDTVIYLYKLLHDNYNSTKFSKMCQVSSNQLLHSQNFHLMQVTDKQTFKHATWSITQYTHALNCSAHTCMGVKKQTALITHYIIYMYYHIVLTEEDNSIQEDAFEATSNIFYFYLFIYLSF